MKVSINWIEELVELNKPLDEVVELINLRTIGTKEVTDKYIELDMKGYNRADLLSLRGVALELSAILDSRIRFEELQSSDYVWVDKGLAELEVDIQSGELVPVYCLAKIEGLKVGPSEKEWIEKLQDSGFRSINNVADVTNLVMLEYGQPLHAFDGGQVNGNVGVRQAREGEKIVTINGKTRNLSKEDLVIADGDGPIGIAGVMGGKDSEVSDKTTTVLLEAAIFDPGSLRKTATRLGLASEASKRFYHGLARKRLLQALDAAIRMYEGLGGKLTALTLRGGFEDISPKITLKLEKLNSLVGVEFKSTEVENYLKRLRFEAKRVDDFSWVVTPPYYRLDVSIEEDVIEEVARMYGYERIPARDLPGESPNPIDQSLFKLISRLKDELVSLGLSEVQTYSYYSTEVLTALGFDEKKKNTLIRVTNPISKETEYLRQSIWANLLEAAAKNGKQGVKDLAIFEVGKVFFPKEGEWPEEKWSVAGLIINGSENPLAEINWILKRIQGEIKEFKDLEIVPSEPPGIVKNVFHPNRFLEIKLGGEQIGGAGEIHSRITDKFGITHRVAVLELGVKKLLESAG